MTRILVIEDEPKTGASLCQGLREAGFAVTLVTRGDEGLLVARSGEHALVLLDITLPRRSGWEILERLRADQSRVPILCLTARDTIEERVRGLDLGADDYLVKPFALAELLARVRTLLRRGPSAEARRLNVGDLEIDLVTRRASRAGQDLGLTPKELALLAFFAEHRGQPLARSFIAESVWGVPLSGQSNVIDVAVRRLRAKVDDPFPSPLIHMVRGKGYVLRDA